MKYVRMISLCFIFIPCMTAWGMGFMQSKPETYREKLNEALWGDGAKARLDYHIKDDKGSPVADATCITSFWYKNVDSCILKEPKTDEQGYAFAEGKSTDDSHYTIKKDGYYKSKGVYKFSRLNEISVKDGKWIPYGKEIDVVLKPIKNPIPMYFYRFEGVLPKGSFELGFDLFEKDWLPPHGKGKHADMIYRYDEKREKLGTYDLLLTLSFPGEKNGATVLKKDLYSDFHSVYEVSEIKTQSLKYKLIRINGEYQAEERFSDDDYLTFRIRTKLNEKGEIISAYYGKIYGPITVPNSRNQRMKFAYYLNPIANDRNIECDMKKNLFNPEWNDHTQRIKMP